MSNLRIALQAKGRLNADSTALLREAGINVEDPGRKFLAKSSSFPAELLYLRDDDIPRAVGMGAADLGIVGYNEVLEREEPVEVVRHLGWGACHLSLAVPSSAQYDGPEWFSGKRIATSYPNILRGFLREKGISASVHQIAGSVEVAPSVGLADAVFDIVSSGGTLLRNSLVEVYRVVESEAVLISGPSLHSDAGKESDLGRLLFRFDSVMQSRGKKYLLMNIPDDRLEEAIRIVPAMRSPTVLPLAQRGWSSLHSVVEEDVLWDKVQALKAVGAEGILVLDVEKLIL